MRAKTSNNVDKVRGFCSGVGMTAYDCHGLAECEWAKEGGWIKEYDIDCDFFEEITSAAQEKGLDICHDREEIIRRICDAYDGAPDSKSPNVRDVL